MTSNPKIDNLEISIGGYEFGSPRADFDGKFGFLTVTQSSPQKQIPDQRIQFSVFSLNELNIVKRLFCIFLLLALIFPACQSNNKVWHVRSLPAGEYPPGLLGSLRKGHDELSKESKKLQKKVELLKSLEGIDSSLTKLGETKPTAPYYKIWLELSASKNNIVLLQKHLEQRQKDFANLRSEISNAKDEISMLRKLNAELEDIIKNIVSEDSIISERDIDETAKPVEDL